MSNEIAVQNDRPTMLAPANMEQAMKLAEMMSGAKLVPLHLQGKPADCLLVIEQASRWKMSPFAVAQCTSVISGKLMYEGKLVAAVVNANGGLDERLSFAYSGDGESRKITVSGKFRGEKEARTVDVVFKDVKTANSMWQKQPDQQLMYSGTRAWARRHAPELMLGVYSPEEFDVAPMVNITPAPQPKSPFAKAVLRKQFQENVRKAFNDTRSLAELAELAALYKPKFDEMEAGGHEHDMLLLDDLRTCYQTCANRCRVGAQHDEETGEVYPNAGDYPPEVLADVIRENAAAAGAQSPDGVMPEFLQPGFKRSLPDAMTSGDMDYRG